MGMLMGKEKCRTIQGLLFCAVDQLRPKVRLVQYILTNTPVMITTSTCIPTQKKKTPDWFKVQKSLAMWAACVRGHFEIYKLLWDAKTNIHFDSLVDAAKADSGKIITHLISNVSVTKVAPFKVKALLVACEFGKTSAFNALWQNAPKEVRNIQMLVAACKGGNTIIVNEVAEGQDVNQLENGVTPLYEAVSRGHKNVVELLISKGARTVYKKKDDTPVKLAKSCGFDDICDVQR